MKNTLLLLFVVCASQSSQGQIPSRFYYNRYWQLTRKDSVHYFRVSVFDSSSYVFAGEVRDFTRNGKLIMKGNYHDGKKDGEFIFYFANGRIRSMGDFKENERKGIWKNFYENGTPRNEIEFNGNQDYKIIYLNDSTGKRLMENGDGSWIEEYEAFDVPQTIINRGSYEDSRKTGKWTCRLRDGTRVYREKYKDGKFVKGVAYENGKKTDYKIPVENHLLVDYKFLLTESLSFVNGVSEDDYPVLRRKRVFQMKPIGTMRIDSIYTVVEEPAHPVEGLIAFDKAVSNEMKYPPTARQARIEGQVVVEFVVNEDGSLTNIRVANGIGGGCNEEAIRILKQVSAKAGWSPGRHNGTPVKQRCFVTIVFRLE